MHCRMAYGVFEIANVEYWDNQLDVGIMPDTIN